MDDRAFDERLMLELSAAQPGELPQQQVDPWRRVLNYLIAGTVLCALNLQFLWLQHILPAVGGVLLLLAYRALRRENGWFAACWGISLFEVVRIFCVLTLNATRWASVLQGSAGTALTALSVLFNLTQAFCLWRGLLAFQLRAGEQEPSAAPAFALLIWKLAMTALALLGGGGWGLVIAMLVIFICILYNLNKLYELLRHTGFALRDAPVRLSDRLLGWGYLGACLICVVACGLAFTRYPMDWMPAEAEEHSGLEEIEENLRALGFPEEVLSELSREDLARLEGARWVKTNIDVVEDWGKRSEYHNSEDVDLSVLGEDVQYIYYGIAVELPAAEGSVRSWAILHAFRAVKEPAGRGTEALEIWPIWQGDDSVYASTDVLPSGRLLYEAGGETYTSDYARLEALSYTSTSMFFGTQTQEGIIAEFSAPRKGTNFRGYVLYRAEEFEDGWVKTGFVNHTRQSSFLVYPFRTAGEYALQWGFSDETFSTNQVVLQFRPGEEGE